MKWLSILAKKNAGEAYRVHTTFPQKEFDVAQNFESNKIFQKFLFFLWLVTLKAHLLTSNVNVNVNVNG